MSGLTWALFGATLAIAVVDWYAVGTDNRPLEYAAKPATMVALFAATVAIDPHDEAVQTAFLVAIVFGLAGDVFLMLPKDLFVFGLASFLVGHLAYVWGMAIDGVEPAPAAVGGVLVLVALVTLGRRIVGAVRASATPELAAPVVLYMLVISAMVVAAFGIERPIAVVGALLFYASDALIGWTRFVGDVRHGRLLIITTYHLGQVGIVLSLAT